MAEHNVTLERTLSTLLESKRYSTIKDILVTMNPADIAAVFNGIESDKFPLLFRLLPKELAAESFVEMESEGQEVLIRGFSDSELKEVIDELYVDDAADIVEEMPSNVVKRILAQADPQMRREVNEILRYPVNSAGSISLTIICKKQWVCYMPICHPLCNSSFKPKAKPCLQLFRFLNDARFGMPNLPT